jgi:hypothetical protein
VLNEMILRNLSVRYILFDLLRILARILVIDMTDMV